MAENGVLGDCTKVGHRKITENSQVVNLDAVHKTYAWPFAIQSHERQKAASDLVSAIAVVDTCAAVIGPGTPS